jgi:hypothetical protein
MTSHELLSTISTKCLAGNPVPAALKKIWEVAQDDKYIANFLGINLLTDQEPVISKYSASEYLNAFNLLGFFATTYDNSDWAFFLSPASLADPPVLEIDSEGSFQWRGLNLAEALFSQAMRIALDEDDEDEQVDFAREWLSKHGLDVSGYGEYSTQFLPDFYYRVAEPEQPLEPPLKLADPTDVETWLLRPGAEVQQAIQSATGLTTAALAQKRWVRCDGLGNVCSVLLKKSPENEGLKLRDIGFTSTEQDVRNAFGTPTDECDVGVRYLRYDLPDGRIIRFEFGMKNVRDIRLMTNYSQDVRFL